jgi:hypothetical protein
MVVGCTNKEGLSTSENHELAVAGMHLGRGARRCTMINC